MHVLFKAVKRSVSFRNNVAVYFSNSWNRFDLLINALFAVSVALRYTLVDEDTFSWAHWTYSITLGCCYMRFMQVFYVERNTGPKLTMIKLMVGFNACTM